jgi:hypothetical protein
MAEPKLPPKSFQLAIEAYVRDAANPDEVANRLIALYEKLNGYSLPKYGRGSLVEEFDPWLLTSVVHGSSVTQINP